MQVLTLHHEWNNLSKELCTEFEDVHYHDKGSNAPKCCLLHILVDHQLQLVVVVLVVVVIDVNPESTLAQFEILSNVKHERLDGPKYIAEALSGMQH